MLRIQVTALLTILAASAVMRASLLPVAGSADLFLLRAFAERLADVGPHDYYLANYQHYLPGYLYILWGIGELFQLTPVRTASDTTHIIILKLPANVFDSATAILVFEILRKRSSGYLAPLAAGLYLFNPAIFYNSAIWGQFDAVPTFFMLLAFYLFTKEKYEFSAAAMAISLLVKTQTVCLLPIYSLAFILRAPPKRVLISAALALALLALVPLPFFWTDPLLGLPSLVQHQQDYYSFDSVNAFNLWWILAGLEVDSASYLGLSHQTWGRVLWLIAQVAIGFWLVRRQRDDWSVYWAASLSLFAFFILPTRIHERYLFPFFSFFLISASVSRNRILLVALYVCVSVFHFLNLYAVEPPSGYPIVDSLFSFIISEHVAISCFLVASFVFLLFGSLFTLLFRPRIAGQEFELP